eukprot:13139367-Alexandrium_andersonii.AAC.1
MAAASKGKASGVRQERSRKCNRVANISHYLQQSAAREHQERNERAAGEQQARSKRARNATRAQERRGN